jgi:hypothetical protein
MVFDVMWCFNNTFCKLEEGLSLDNKRQNTWDNIGENKARQHKPLTIHGKSIFTFRVLCCLVLSYIVLYCVVLCCLGLAQSWPQSCPVLALAFPNWCSTLWTIKYINTPRTTLDRNTAPGQHQDENKAKEAFFFWSIWRPLFLSFLLYPLWNDFVLSFVYPLSDSNDAKRFKSV